MIKFKNEFERACLEYFMFEFCILCVDFNVNITQELLGPKMKIISIDTNTHTLSSFNIIKHFLVAIKKIHIEALLSPFYQQ